MPLISLLAADHLAALDLIAILPEFDHIARNIITTAEIPDAVECTFWATRGSGAALSSTTPSASLACGV
ncbi:MAG: hypothetical protein R3F13_06315 [Prosthecobacter sp.]